MGRSRSAELVRPSLVGQAVRGARECCASRFVRGGLSARAHLCGAVLLWWEVVLDGGVAVVAQGVCFFHGW